MKYGYVRMEVRVSWPIGAASFISILLRNIYKWKLYQNFLTLIMTDKTTTIHVQVTKLIDNDNTLKKNDFYIYRDVIFSVEIMLAITFLSLIIRLLRPTRQP